MQWMKAIRTLRHALGACGLIVLLVVTLNACKSTSGTTTSEREGRRTDTTTATTTTTDTSARNQQNRSTWDTTTSATRERNRSMDTTTYGGAQNRSQGSDTTLSSGRARMGDTTMGRSGERQGVDTSFGTTGRGRRQSGIDTGNTSAGQEASVVNIRLSEYTIDMPSTIGSGTTTFRISNTGNEDHGLEISGNNLITKQASVTLAPGESKSLQVNLAPGTYEVYCPEHKGRGMTTTLTVTGH